MTATNHALTGSVIGLIVANPVAAIVLAFVSHFVLDATPHFDFGVNEKQQLKSNWFRNYLVLEATLCFLIVLTLFLFHPINWVIAAVCAFVAASPDLESIRKYHLIRTDKPYKPNAYERFAGGIQWFAKPIGGFVELFWASAMVFILGKLLLIW